MFPFKKRFVAHVIFKKITEAKSLLCELIIMIYTIKKKKGMRDELSIRFISEFKAIKG